LPVGVYAASPHGEVLEANPALIELLGFPDRDALRGQALAELCAEAEDRGLWRCQESRPGGDGERRDFETRLLRYDGRPVWVKAAIRAVRDGAGQVQYCVGSLTDVTAQRLAEEGHREAEGLFQAIVNHATEGAAVADLETLELRAASSSLCQMLGYSPDQMTELRLTDLMQTDDAAIDRLLDEQAGAADDVALRHKDGGTLTTDLTLGRVDMAGRPCLLAVVRNAADRHLVASVLRESRRLIKDVTEAATLLFYVVDLANRRCIRVSPEAHRLATTPDEAADLASSLLDERVHPEDRPAVDRLLERAAELPDDDLQVEEGWRLRDAQGQWRWFRHRAGVFSRGPDGTVTRILCVAQDVTEQAEDREGRRAAEAQLEAILEHASGFLVLLNPTGELLQASRAALQFARAPREALIGAPLWDGHWRTASERDGERLGRAIVRAAHGRAQPCRVQFLDGDDRTVTIDLVVKPVGESQGETAYLLAEGLHVPTNPDRPAP
jgi:PAS domain S-box-containing protein